LPPSEVLAFQQIPQHTADMKPIALTLCFLVWLSPGHALAWGGSGHRMIAQAALESLPADLPPFLRTPKAAADVGELAREPDRWKGAGKVHDQNRDPAHFLDIMDDGSILGGPRLETLPATRKDYEAALKIAGTNSWDAGYLPYAILDAQQQLTKDLAFWRVISAAERLERNPERRAWLNADRARREYLILVTLGQLSHYLGDGSQPLHLTVHFNGWGDFPNPQGYTLARYMARLKAILSLLISGKQMFAGLSRPQSLLMVLWTCGLRPTY